MLYHLATSQTRTQKFFIISVYLSFNWQFGLICSIEIGPRFYILLLKLYFRNNVVRTYFKYIIDEGISIEVLSSLTLKCSKLACFLICIMKAIT